MNILSLTLKPLSARKLYYKLLLILFYFLGISLVSNAQIDSSYEQLSVTLLTRDLGNTEIPAVIHEVRLWLPVKDLFDFLGINCIEAPGLGNINGTFITPDGQFIMDRSNNSITYKSRQFSLARAGLIYFDNELYLRTDYFSLIFGLKCDFNFRALSVNLQSEFELPAVREKRQALMRQNLSKVKAERKVDTTIQNHFQPFHFGALDWQVNSLQQLGGKSNTRINLDIGAMAAGGELDAYFNYNSQVPFLLKDQIYIWRYINNDNSVFKQLNVGRIFTQSTSSLLAPLNGIQITNRPTTYKKSFGSYIISNTTEPDWIVELYVNNVLVNYTKADGSGFFSFDVPLVYGSSAITFKYYGPLGEERSTEETINIPYVFLPKNQFEYSLTAGIVSDNYDSKFTRASLNYGLNSRVTIGTGIEYLSSVESGRPMPFVNASIRLQQGIILSAEHTYNVRTKANLSYRFAKKLQFEASYVKYQPGQDAVKVNYKEEKKAIVSMPFQAKNFNGFSRFTFNRITLGDGKLTNTELLLGGMAAGINCNLTTTAFFTKSSLFFSKLSVTFRLPKGIRLTPQAQYAYHLKRFDVIRTEAEKQILNRGFLNVSYERNMILKTNFYLLGTRYNFSFAQASFYAKQNNQSLSILQSATGGFLYNEHNADITANNIKNVGKGAIVLLPFLDYNCNGKRDNNEPDESSLNARIVGGRISRSPKQPGIKITGLEAYNKYFIDLDESSFENTSWKIKNKVIAVTAQPNHLTAIEIPIEVFGEVSGYMTLQEGNAKKGIGRIIVNIYNEENILVAKTLTEFDGYFNYLGLPPGNYTASPDREQLSKINMKIKGESIPFVIHSTKEGDIVDGLELTLIPVENK